MPVVPKDACFAVRPEVRYRPMPSGGILVNLATGACFELNRTGALLWADIAAGATVEAAIAALRAAHDDAPDTIEGDAIRLCTTWLDEGLVRARAPEVRAVKDPDRGRYVLETFTDGGLLLDLHTGDFFCLNPTAALVWRLALTGRRTADVAVELTRAFDVSPAAAADDVASALSTPNLGAAPHVPSETHYELDGDRYRFSVRGAPVFEIAGSGQALRALRDGGPETLRLDLRTVCPKLLALRGASVLHASAVRRGAEPVIAFLGESGAGKTTIARAFAAGGYDLVCEDKLLLRRAGDEVRVVVGGEANVERWLRDLEARVRAAGVGSWCDLNGTAGALDVADTTADRPAALGEVLFLDRARRHGSTIERHPAGPTAAAGEIFRHAFYGSSTSAEWRMSAAVSARLARTTPASFAVMPAGVALLADAVRGYRLKTQSY